MLYCFFRGENFLLSWQSDWAWLRVRWNRMGSVFDSKLVGCVRPIWSRVIIFGQRGSLRIGLGFRIVSFASGEYIDGSPGFLYLFILNSVACLKMVVLDMMRGTYLSAAKFFLQRWQRLGRRLTGKLSAGRLLTCLVLSILKKISYMWDDACLPSFWR